MNADIIEAKRRLPLPTLMNQLGLGEHVSKSARCPFHEDKRNSFSAWSNERGEHLFKCHAGCGAGDEINLLELHSRISRAEAIKLFLEMAGVNGYAPSVPNALRANQPQSARSKFDWQGCVEALTAEHLQNLAKWRGYSPEFCQCLHQRALVGLYDGCIAFPIHDGAKVLAAHHRLPDGSWRVFPQGTVMRPLIIGDMANATVVHAFESQWDALALCDKLALHLNESVALIITRGAGNAALVREMIPSNTTVYAWPQNNPLRNGKRAGDEWLKALCNSVRTTVQCVTTPASFKDLNEWTHRGAATRDQLQCAIEEAQPARQKESPARFGGSSLNSRVRSCELADDYPSPMAPAALYGLSGEVVRLIEPHTQADPAALLFQLLAAFGNIIGHDKYIIADGARHQLNLYGVLVGQSSKSRKGTSWNHAYLSEHGC